MNLPSAFLALAGFVWYTLVYTVWLKRRSPQNIVIGGAAGAIPPLVGWAAVTGSVAPAALYLFAIIFYWTPPHFWALSLLMKDEYARVGVPMMPVVHGEAETRRQIVLYTFLLTFLTLLPFVFGFFGVIYAVFAAGLGGAFITLALRLQRRADRKSALRAYLFSLAYLAALFVAMVWTPSSNGSQTRPPQPPDRLLRQHHRRPDVRAHLRRRPLLHLMSDLETTNGNPARRRRDPHAGAEHPAAHQRGRARADDRLDHALVVPRRLRR